jgi:ADP-ribose pyrophosphatase YjhB (NUDIX family)
MTGDRDDIRAPERRREDFLGAFALIEDARGVLMVANRRCVAGTWTQVWDLPGGQVEPGELLHEALARELREELAIEARGSPQLLFQQEGERRIAGRRAYVWRSFFFRVAEFAGTPRAGGEVQGVHWFGRAALGAVLTAPYHDSFRQWLRDGGTLFTSVWED